MFSLSSRLRPNVGQLAAIFFRIGNTTFGGGDPTISVLQREFARRGWLSGEEFTLAYALCRATPGTNLLAFCAGSAFLMLGVTGAIVAILAITVPSALLVIWLTRVCELVDSNPWAHAALAGTVSAAVGSMLATGLIIARPYMSRATWLPAAVIVAASFILASTVLSPIQVLGIAAVAGLFWTRA